MKRKTTVPQSEYPMVIETFRPPAYGVNQVRQDEPSCFNSMIQVRRYRVTAELIDEPDEVICERLLMLWYQCDNHHHFAPLQAVAKSYGLALDPNEFGKNHGGRRR